MKTTIIATILSLIGTSIMGSYIFSWNLFGNVEQKLQNIDNKIERIYALLLSERG